MNLKIVLVLTACIAFSTTHGAEVEHFSTDDGLKTVALAKQAWEFHKKKEYAQSFKLFREVLEKKLDADALADAMPWRITSAYNCACAAAMLKDPESAIQYLSRAVELGFDEAENMKSDPELTTLHEDKRFRDLLEIAARRGSEKQTLTGTALVLPHQQRPALVVPGAGGAPERVLVLTLNEESAQKFSDAIKARRAIQIEGTGGGIRNKCVFVVESLR